MTTNNSTNLPIIVPLASGGTSNSSATPAFNALSPLTTKGDIIAYTGATNSRLAVGADTKGLGSDSSQTTGLNWNTVTTSTFLKSSSTVLTASQVLNLRATPITVLAAPGAGKVAKVYSWVAKYTYGGNNAFTNPQNFALRYVNGSGAIAGGSGTTSGFITVTNNECKIFNPSNTVNFTVSQCENQLICVHNEGASEITGNASLDNTVTIIVYYYVTNI